MQSLTIKVRARTAKEVVNLGFIVARRYFFAALFALLPAWAITSLLALIVALYSGSATVAIIIVWWLKPLYERPVLLRLSRDLFAQPCTWRESQKAIFAPAWWAELTYLRPFASMRIVRHAVIILETLSGKEKRDRLRFFRRHAHIDLGALLLLSVAELGFILTVILLIPNLPEIPWHLAAYDEEAFRLQTVWLSTLIAVLYAPAAALMSIFFVSIGFMYYINQRVIDEGWALALDLQALATRLSRSVLALFLTILLVGFSFTPPPAYAISEQERQQDHARVEALINDPALGPYRMRRIPAAKKSSAPLNHSDFSLSAEITRAFFIIIAVAALFRTLSIIMRRSFRLPSLQPTKSLPASAAAAIHRHDALHAENLDVAWQFCKNGNMTAALAIIYGRLLAAPELHRLPAFLRGESESEYLARSRGQTPPAHHDFVRDLLTLWQKAAYAHQPLPEAEVANVIQRYRTLWP